MKSSSGPTDKRRSAISRVINTSLVVVQFVAAAALVVTTKLSQENWGWMSCSLAGITLGIWAIVAIGPTRVTVSPDLKSATRLVTAGPYRLIRHPMYTALSLFAGGLVFMPFRYWRLVAYGILLLVLIAKSAIEERQLLERFETYAGYRSATRRFIPYLW